MWQLLSLLRVAYYQPRFLLNKLVQMSYLPKICYSFFTLAEIHFSCLFCQQKGYTRVVACSDVKMEFRHTDLRCNDNEEQSSLPDEPSPVQMLPSCCAVTSYQFLSNASTPHKLLLGGRNSEKLAEYKGNVEVQVTIVPTGTFPS